MKRKQINWEELFKYKYPYVKDDLLNLSKFSCIPLRLLPKDEPYKFILKIFKLREGNNKIPKKYIEAVLYSDYIPRIYQ